MNKKLSILSLLFGLFLCVTAFCACGGDDESSSGDNNGSGSIPQTSKHVAKIITEEGGSIYEDTYIYDSQGRVTNIIGTESGTSGFFRSEKTYQYGETLIITKWVKEGTLSNGQSESRSESHAYTIENGRIVKDEEKQGSQIDGGQWHYSSWTETFSYDANNYLSSKGNTIVTWSNGNLVKFGNGTGTYSYSNYTWVKGFPFNLKGIDMDGYLISIGYYGNTPRTLPSKYSVSETYGWSYEYTLQDNYVTKIIYKPFVEDHKSQKAISTIIWE